MIDLTAGLHLILVPAGGFVLHRGLADSLNRATVKALQHHNVQLHALDVQTDHVHILLSTSEADSIHEIIGTVVGATLRSIAASSTSMRDFVWDHGVHVTLLPPWHIEIMASFVRDQSNYHARYTLEQELDLVFRPNSACLEEDEEENSTLCIN